MIGAHQLMHACVQRGRLRHHDHFSYLYATDARSKIRYVPMISVCGLIYEYEYETHNIGGDECCRDYFDFS